MRSADKLHVRIAKGVYTRESCESGIVFFQVVATSYDKSVFQLSSANTG